MKTAGDRESTPTGNATPPGRYEIVPSNRVRQQLHHAPPILRGYQAGITAILRIDPTAASTMLHIRPTEGDAWTATYGAGQGFVTYRVIESQRLVVLLDWVWAG